MNLTLNMCQDYFKKIKNEKKKNSHFIFSFYCFFDVLLVQVVYTITGRFTWVDALSERDCFVPVMQLIRTVATPYNDTAPCNLPFFLCEPYKQFTGAPSKWAHHIHDQLELCPRIWPLFLVSSVVTLALPGPSVAGIPAGTSSGDPLLLLCPH